jgi:hypothetical protein
MRFVAMRAKRFSSLSWRANFAESLMPSVRNSPMPVGEKSSLGGWDCILATVDASFTIKALMDGLASTRLDQVTIYRHARFVHADGPEARL